MTKTVVLILATIGFLGCSKVSIDSETIIGEWRYVGTFDHRANYDCYLCPDFGYEKSIYRINFEADGSFTGNINLLIVDGTYEITQKTSAQNSFDGSIVIKKYRLLNRPPETIADSDFQKLFNAVSYFNLYKGLPESFDQLTLGNSSDQFLFFVRKK